MAGAGTGQPSAAGCIKCRGEWHLLWRQGLSRLRRGEIDRLQLTGRVRSVPFGRGGSRVVFTRYEYTCLDCGHVGWSRHYDVAKKADAQGIRPHKNDTRGIERFERGAEKTR
jgi:hypothetical protein